MITRGAVAVNRNFVVTLFENCYAVTGTEVQLTDQQMINLLTWPKKHDGVKLNCKGWSPTRYSGGYRRKSNVEAVSAIVLDFDGGLSIENAKYLMGTDYFWILHTSWSHSPEEDKFRIVIPMSKDLSAHDMALVWPVWAERFDHEVDKHCSDPGRFWFLPMEGHTEHHVNRGELYDPSDDLAEAKKEKIKNLVAFTSPANEVKVKGSPSSPITRERVGLLLGGKKSGNTMRGITCPKCNRPSLWWWISIDQGKSPIYGAMCSHKNSCRYMCGIFSLTRS